jgi:hypothetical protein
LGCQFGGAIRGYAGKGTRMICTDLETYVLQGMEVVAEVSDVERGREGG